MHTEQTFLLSLLREHLQGRTTAPRADLDWQALLALARSHQLAAIVYDQCGAFLPSEVRDSFRSAHAAALFAGANRRAVTDRVLSRLRAEGVEAFLVKGPVFAACYPKPELRTMGDCDLVTRERERVHAVLLKEGFVCTEIRNAHSEWQYSWNGLKFELHDCLCKEKKFFSEEITRFFNDFDSYVRDGRAEESFHFLFGIFHLQKHFLCGGVGLRQFMDLAAAARCARLDLAWIAERLEALGMRPFAERVFFLLERWFEVPPPFACEQPEDFLQEATELIFSNGVFGADRPGNEKNIAIHHVLPSRHRRLAMLGVARERLFPAYGDLVGNGKYPFLRGRPWLLPFAWVYRLGRTAVKGEMRLGAAHFRNSFASRDAVRERERVLQNWGLK